MNGTGRTIGKFALRQAQGERDGEPCVSTPFVTLRTGFDRLRTNGGEGRQWSSKPFVVSATAGSSRTMNGTGRTIGKVALRQAPGARGGEPCVSTPFVKL